ncbi:uncharacterized protein N7483_000081 [Penicillium malachiteum]|uniref:uncharacterized protein n=1 Tax=Penicillium malachiteum TaxID=1324776 RepID=UPI002546FB88|nr:uncharacterized protein N7483_000081 [Penicillium malachiteum]KAJ5734956.1 hypothetical protein N7483_000081 [Penicillium malachiteum]
MSDLSLEWLGSIIYAKAKALSRLAAKNGDPPILDGTIRSNSSSASIVTTRNELIQATNELLQLVMMPSEYLLSLALSGANTANIELLIRFEIPQNVPLDSSIEISALSTKVNLPEDDLRRTLRFAISNGIFQEPTPNTISHSALSTALDTDTHLRNVLCFSAEWTGGVLTKTPKYLALRAEGKNVPKTSFGFSFNTEEDFFDYMTHSKELNAKYHNFLMGRAHTPMWSMDRLRAAWDWASLGSKTLVDVGGSSGHTVMAIAPLAPYAQFIVQDNDSSALELGKTQSQKLLDDETRSRIAFQKHNFFEGQPVRAECYILRHVLHDWNDQDSIAILKALLVALEPGARVFISEGLLPDPPAQRLNTLASKMILIEDQFIMTAHNAHERTLNDYVQLVKQVSQRFNLVGVTSGAKDGAFQSLLEFQFD